MKPSAPALVLAALAIAYMLADLAGGTEVVRDAAGRIIQTADRAGRTLVVRDAAGRITHTASTSRTATGSSTTYRDAAGRVVATFNGGGGRATAAPRPWRPYAAPPSPPVRK